MIKTFNAKIGSKKRLKSAYVYCEKIPVEILMPGSRFYVNGATVYHCVNGSFMTLHLKDGAVHLDENNEDYVGEYAPLTDSASDNAAGIFASDILLTSE